MVVAIQGVALTTDLPVFGGSTAPTLTGTSSNGTRGLGNRLRSCAGKHPYQHPYGIAPCVPSRPMERKSSQLGVIDAGIPRIRYAVPLQSQYLVLSVRI